MRTTLFSGLLQNLSLSLRHQAQTVRLYELGRTYREGQADDVRQPVASEQLRLAGILWGHRYGRAWTAKDAAMDFFDAKGAVETVLDSIGIREAKFESGESPSLHPRASARVLSGKTAICSATPNRCGFPARSASNSTCFAPISDVLIS